MAAIRTHNLTKRFGDVVAVDGLGLAVEEGKVRFHLDAWFSVVVLLVWELVPVVAGYWWLENADLG